MKNNGYNIRIVCLNPVDLLYKQTETQKLKTMKKLTPTEKKKLLAKMLELMVNMGLEIEPYMGLPLGKFNYENVQKQIEKLTIDLEYVHSE